jgi:hypothetical protein
LHSGYNYASTEVPVLLWGLPVTQMEGILVAGTVTMMSLVVFPEVGSWIIGIGIGVVYVLGYAEIRRVRRMRRLRGWLRWAKHERESHPTA